MSVNIQTDKGLKLLADKTTKKKVISALGYTPANEEDLKNYATLVDLSGYLPKEDDGDSFSIADPNGNIIFQVNQNGVNSVDYLIKGKSILTTIQESVFSGDYNDLINKPIESTGEDTDFAISDKNGNLIIKIDAAGVNAAAYMIKGVSLYDIFTDENYVDQSVDDLRSEVEQNYTTYEYVDNTVSNAVNGISLNASNITYEDNVGYGTDNVQDTLDLIFGHNHDSIYLKITDAASTYATKTSLNNYLTIVDAEATYLPQIDEGDSFTITDEDGNIAFQVNQNGVNAAAYLVKGVDIANIYASISHDHDSVYLKIADYKIDDALDLYSNNPVKNKVITMALQDIENDYATIDSLNDYLPKSNGEATGLKVKDSIELGEYSGQYGIELTASDDDTLLVNGNEVAFTSSIPDVSVYLKITDAASTYLSKTDASSIYAPRTLLTNYLTITEAAETYLPKADDSDLFAITDEPGNIVFQIDKNGVNSVNYYIKGVSLYNIFTDEDYVDQKVDDLRSEIEQNYPTYNEMDTAISNAINTGSIDASDVTYTSYPEYGVSNVQEALDVLYEHNHDSVYSKLGHNHDDVYLKIADASSTYFTKDEWSSNYTALQQNIAGTYATQASLSDYLKSTDAASTYLKKADYKAYTLPQATSDALGGVKIGYTDNGKAYGVKLDTNGKMYVNVPWVEYTLPEATSSAIGGVKMDTTGQCLDQADAKIVPDAASIVSYVSTKIAEAVTGGEVDLSGYLTISAAESTYVTQSNFTALQQNIAQTYATQASLNGYLLASTASSTYATISSLSSYLKTTDAASTYLSKTDAASTYATKDSLSGYLTSDSLSGYLKTADYVVDSALSLTSTNPVQNGVITKELQDIESNISNTYLPKSNGVATGLKVTDSIELGEYNGSYGIELTATDDDRLAVNGNEVAHVGDIPDVSDCLRKTSNSDSFTLADEAGNVIFTVDQNGVNTTKLTLGFLPIESDETSENLLVRGKPLAFVPDFVTSLPAASEDYRGKSIILAGEDTDELYICLKISNAYTWVKMSSEDAIYNSLLNDTYGSA